MGARLECLKARPERYGVDDVLFEVVRQVAERRVHDGRLLLLDNQLVDQIDGTLLSAGAQTIQLLLQVVEYVAAADEQYLLLAVHFEDVSDRVAERVYT